MGESVVVAEDVSKHYGPVQALDAVSFTVAANEIVGLLGPNGAGKSTAMRILTGFTPAASGKAHVAGFEVHTDPDEVKRRVGYLPERVPLYEEMVVDAFLRFVAEIKGVAKPERQASVDTALERCGLTHMRRRIIGNLSKGYRQRVGLAQALLGSPPVLILDEPTVGLDPQQIIEIRQMIGDLSQDHTVLLSTHILPEVEMVCGRVLILNRGRLAAERSLADGDNADRQLHIRARGDAGVVLTALRGTPGIADAKRGADGYVAMVEGEADAAPAAIKRLCDAGVDVQRIHEERRSLEATFLDAISSESVSGPADSGSVA